MSGQQRPQPGDEGQRTAQIAGGEPRADENPVLANARSARQTRGDEQRRQPEDDEEQRGHGGVHDQLEEAEAAERAAAA